MRKGRTSRHRRRKSDDVARSLGCDAEFINLLKWMKNNGFKGTFLTPANFKETGRGLMATNSVKKGDQLISIPENLLITTQTVLNSYLTPIIRSQSPRLSPAQVLCTFLICERHRQHLSFWHHYILTLPKDFTSPVYFEDKDLQLLPHAIRTRAFHEKEKMIQAYREMEAFLVNVQTRFPEFKGIFTFEAFCWAWCVVNTRTVYMEQKKSLCLSEDVDHYALAPMLDMLNHTDSVEVYAGFNTITRCYEICTRSACKKYDQVFIHYGPHDNIKLFLEYGFLLPKNDQNFVDIQLGPILDCVTHLHRTKQDRSFLDWKISLLKSSGSLTNLTCSLDGVSWKLMTVMQILCLRPEEKSNWKSILLGQFPCSRSCAKMAVHLLKRILTNEVRSMESLCKVPEYLLATFHGQIIQQIRNEAQEILERSLALLESG